MKAQLRFENFMVVGKFEITTEENKYLEFIEVCSLDLELFNKITNIKNKFETEYNVTIEPVTAYEEVDKYYFFVLKNLESKTSKNNKTYYSLELSDGASSVKMVIWEDAYDRLKDTLEIGGIYVTKFSKDGYWLRFQDGAQFRRIY